MTDQEIREYSSFVRDVSRWVDEILTDQKRFAELKRDVRRAEKRVGDKAKWLLKFAYLDLAKVNNIAFNDLRLEIFAFALSEYKPPKEFSTGFFEPLPYLFRVFSLSRLGSTNSLVDFFQSELRKRFDDSIQGRWWEYRRPAPVERFRIFRRRSPEGVHYVDNTGGDGISVPDILLGIATDVLKRERERFGICQNLRCGNPFVAERKNRAKYCSPKCAAYVRVNRKRGKL